MEEQKYEVAIRPGANESLALQRVSEGLFKSGLFPNAKNPYGAFAITQYGAELGVGPMMSLKNINIISGQLAANGQLMLSLAMSKGVTYQVVVETPEEVTMIFKRPGFVDHRASFTWEDAEKAKLTDKENWKKYPKDMLYWRCVAKGVRRIAPDAVMGLYTPDEISSGDIVDIDNGQEPVTQGSTTTSLAVDEQTKVIKAIEWVENQGMAKDEAEALMGEPITENNLPKLKKVFKAWKDGQAKIVQTEPAQDVEGGPGYGDDTVYCPDLNSKMPIPHCNTQCSKRDGCPAFN